MTAFFGWMFGTRLGRGLTLIAAASAAFFVCLARVWHAGRTFEQSKRDQASLDALRERNKKDDEIAKMDQRHIRDKLARWVQPGAGEP